MHLTFTSCECLDVLCRPWTRRQLFVLSSVNDGWAHFTSRLLKHATVNIGEKKSTWGLKSAVQRWKTRNSTKTQPKWHREGHRDPSLAYRRTDPDSQVWLYLARKWCRLSLKLCEQPSCLKNEAFFFFFERIPSETMALSWEVSFAKTSGGRHVETVF